MSGAGDRPGKKRPERGGAGGSAGAKAKRPERDASGARRPERVAERIKMELMDLLLRGAVRDPAAADCCITDVKVSDDLGHARVYVRLLRDTLTEQAQKDAIAALTRAAGFLRRELSPRLNLKYQPDLRFFWDEGVDQAARIESLLSEIAREGVEK